MVLPIPWRGITPPKPPKLTFWPKQFQNFPAPAGLDDTFRGICINSFPTFYFWAASVICFCFDFSFHFHFTLPPASETTFHFIFTSFAFPHFISFSLHLRTPSEIGSLKSTNLFQGIGTKTRKELTWTVQRRAALFLRASTQKCKSSKMEKTISAAFYTLAISHTLPQVDT